MRPASTSEFDAGFDVDALQDVREGRPAKPDLPEEADEPTVNEVNLSLFPVLMVTLSGDVPERTLVRLARDLRDEIEASRRCWRSTSPATARNWSRSSSIPVLLESYGLNGDEIAPPGQPLQPADRRRRAGYRPGPLRHQGARACSRRLEDILDLPVKVQGDAVVEFRDIATVRRTFKDPRASPGSTASRRWPWRSPSAPARTSSRPSRAVRAVVEEERALWPERSRSPSARTSRPTSAPC